MFQVFQHHLLPQLAKLPSDSKRGDGSGPSGSGDATSPGDGNVYNGVKSEYDDLGSLGGGSKDSKDDGRLGSGPIDDEEETTPPAMIIYVVDPFTYGSHHPELHRLITIGIMRCFLLVSQGLPESVRNNLHLQVSSMSPNNLSLSISCTQVITI